MESDEELELLLSFQNEECIPETPPASPPHDNTQSEKSSMSLNMAQARQAYAANVRKVVCATSDKRAGFIAKTAVEQQALEQVFGYDSDEDLPRSKKVVTMAAFRDVVGTSLEAAMQNKASLSARQPTGPSANGIDVEKHSGLRIKNRMVSSSSLSNRLSDLRFVRLQAIRTAMMGENITGAWATVGVLTEKGMPKVSSTGKNFAIWKLASLDSTTVSVFLFGDAYTQHWKESAGSVAAVFNAKVRRDEKRNEFSLSVFSSDQIMKLGTSVDYSICRGLRKDGTPCTIVISRRHGEYCQYHTAAVRKKYTSKRGELSGGNLATGFADPRKSRGAQVIRTLAESAVDNKLTKPVKHMTSTDLKKVLSNADKVTTKYQSQGIRFLASLAEDNRENIEPKSGMKRQNNEQCGPLQKRGNLNTKARNSSLQQGGKDRDKNMPHQSVLIELDLEGPDDAMAQAMNLFQKGPAGSRAALQ